MVGNPLDMATSNRNRASVPGRSTESERNGTKMQPRKECTEVIVTDHNSDRWPAGLRSVAGWRPPVRCAPVLWWELINQAEALRARTRWGLMPVWHWIQRDNYERARAALDAALATEMMLGGLK